MSGLVSGVVPRWFHLSEQPAGPGLFSGRRLLRLQPAQAGLCAQADCWRVFALDSVHPRVDFRCKNIVTIPETAGMFQPFVRHIA